MANKRLDMLKIKQLLRLYTEGESKLKISSRLDLSRNTVRKYIDLFNTYQLTYQDLNELSDDEVEDLFETKNQLLDRKEELIKNFFPYASKELKKVGVTCYLLWQEYREKHPDGYSYTRFCYHYRMWSRKQSPSVHMNHKAGDKMFVDYTGKKLHIIDRGTGEEKEV